MRKIPTVFMRNIDGNHQVRDEVTPGCEWVLAGEGQPTRKWDGTAIMVRDSKLFKRYEVKKDGVPPDEFEPAQPRDANTGKQAGWVPVTGDKSDKYVLAAVEQGIPTDGTYELCGPKVNGNHDGFNKHVLVRHGAELLADCERTFGNLRDSMAALDIEGIVWWHSDGRRAKLKLKDFGIKRQCESGVAT